LHTVGVASEVEDSGIDKVGFLLTRKQRKGRSQRRMGQSPLAAAPARKAGKGRDGGETRAPRSGEERSGDWSGGGRREAYPNLGWAEQPEESPWMMMIVEMLFFHFNPTSKKISIRPLEKQFSDLYVDEHEGVVYVGAFEIHVDRSVNEVDILIV
jgi:hypothetical protein